MSKILKIIDLYGERIELNIENRTRIKTPIGGIFTIITVGFILACAWTIGKDILYHQEPLISMEDKLFEKRPRLSLDKNSLPIAFTLQDINQVNWDIPKYFKFEIFGSTLFNHNSTGYRTYYNYSKCNYENFPNYPKESFDSSGMANYLCVNNQNFTIEGYWDESLISQLFIRMRLCNNDTDGGGCAPLSEISNFVNKQPISWNIYFQNTIVNTKNSYPLSKYILNLYKSVRLSSYKQFRISIKPQVVNSDLGLIFEDLNIYSCLSFDSMTVDESDPKLVSVIDIVLNVAEHENIYKRSYVKIQNIIANLGGLLKAAVFVLNIFSRIFSKSKILEKISNSIFDFGEADHNDFPESSDSKVRFIRTPLNNQIIKPSALELEKKSNHNLESDKNNIYVFSKPQNNIVDDKKLISQKKIRFSFDFIINYVFCYSCRNTNHISNKNIKLFKKLKEIIYKKLDIRNFIRKGEELEKLKKTILDETQLKIFFLINKHTVKMYDSENNQDFKLETNEKNLIKERLIAFQNKESNINAVDKRLFTQMTENIKQQLLN